MACERQYKNWFEGLRDKLEALGFKPQLVNYFHRKWVASGNIGGGSSKTPANAFYLLLQLISRIQRVHQLM